MKTSLRLAQCGLILSLLVCPVRAEKLFVRNQPFKGASTGVGAGRMVELEPFAKALGFTVKALNGGFLVTTDPKSDQGSEICEAGSAIVDGNRLALSQGPGGQPMISLSEFCNCVGAKLVTNAAMGSSDVYLESKAKARGPSLAVKWGSSGPEERGEGSKNLAEGPGKVAVQFYEAFAMLPPLRDVKEMRGFCTKQADIDKFIRAYKGLVTPELSAKSVPVLEGAINRVMAGSLMLNNVPLDELEQYVATKPDMAKKFTESISSWEALRSGSATLLDQRVRGPEALVKVEQVVTDPVSNKTTKKNVLLFLVQLNGKWKIAGREDE